MHTKRFNVCIKNEIDNNEEKKQSKFYDQKYAIRIIDVRSFVVFFYFNRRMQKMLCFEFVFLLLNGKNHKPV